MHVENLNFDSLDSLDLRDRLVDSALVQWMYLKYHGSAEASRRLNTSADRGGGCRGGCGKMLE